MRPLIFGARFGEIASIVERLRNGQVKPRRNLRLFGELAIDAWRSFLDCVKESFGSLAALEGIAAAEQIVCQELIDRGGNSRFTRRIIAFSGQAQREEHNQAD